MKSLLSCRNNIISNPDYPDSYYNCGLFFLSVSDNKRAINSWQRAIAIEPGMVQAHTNLGNLLSECDFLSEAIVSFRNAVVVKPDHVSAYSNYGSALLEKNHQVSIWLSRRAILLRHDFAQAYNNLGGALIELDQYDESILASRISIALQPDIENAYNNLGISQRLRLYIDDAVISWRRAIKIKPDFADASFSMSLSLLAYGHYEEGWRIYEWRWYAKGMRSTRRSYPQPAWQGENGNGRWLLVFEEQGYGDNLHFCRYLSLVAARGWRILLEVTPPLFRIMQSLRSVEKVVVMGEPLPAFDAWCPMLSFPSIFGTRLETVPAMPAYLYANPSDVEVWRQRFNHQFGKELKIGLAWLGSIMDRKRSIPGRFLHPLLQCQGGVFLKLQTEEDEAIDEEINVIDFMSEVNDFADTAAIIANLDLVITIDTATAHLAGAMGKKVWLLARHDPCWRWLRGRDNSPWYPSMRIFRQTEPEGWVDVIERVRDALVLDYSLSFGEAKSPLPPFSKGGEDRVPPLKKGGRGDFAFSDSKCSVILEPDQGNSYFTLGLSMLGGGGTVCGGRELAKGSDIKSMAC